MSITQCPLVAEYDNLQTQLAEARYIMRHTAQHLHLAQHINLPPSHESTIDNLLISCNSITRYLDKEEPHDSIQKDSSHIRTSTQKAVALVERAQQTNLDNDGLEDWNGLVREVTDK